MATTKQTRQEGGRGWTLSFHALRRLGAWLGLAVVLGVVGVLAWNWPRISSDAIAGASFGARTACACRYVEGRNLAQCRSDFEPGMGLVILSEDGAAKSVTARFPLLATQTATFRPGEGCILEKWAR